MNLGGSLTRQVNKPSCCSQMEVIKKLLNWSRFQSSEMKQKPLLNTSLLLQIEQDNSVSESSPHIANIGRMVEDMENKIRNTLNEIYFGKTRDIVNGLR